jgi:class 3 adenylate cyclase
MSGREPLRSDAHEPDDAGPADVEVSLLFCDVVRSTELTRQLGDRGALAVIQEFHNLVLRAAAPFGGEELEMRGDGVLLAFEGPDPAVDCAIEIQRALEKLPDSRRVSVRVGVHTGSALRIASGYFGSNVILSARVAEQAAPGEILVSAAVVQRLAARALPVDAGRWVALKGIPEASLVFSLHWQPAKAARPRPGPNTAAHAAMMRTLDRRTPEPRAKDDKASCMLAERGGV